MAKKLDEISFLDLLPESIKGDSQVEGAARALDEQIQSVNGLLHVPQLYARLEDLPDRVLDLLAWQFGINTWRPGYSLRSKQDLIRTSIAWHRYLGTPYAVKTVAQAIMGPTEIEEWYEYGGSPYLFRVYINLEARGLSEDEFDRGTEAIMATKNARSHLDLLRVYLSNRSEVPQISTTALSGETVTLFPYNVTLLEQFDTVPRYGFGNHYVDTTTIYPQ